MSRNKLSLLQLIPIIFIGVLIIYVLNPISFTNSMNDVNVYQTSILKSTFQQDYREKVEEIENKSNGNNIKGSNSREKVVNIMKQELDLGISGRPNKYTRWWYGNETAQPWCDIFVSWCFNEAGLLDIPENQVPINFIDGKSPMFPSAYCLTTAKAMNNVYRLCDIKTDYKPRPGDVLLHVYLQSDVSKHIGFVLDYDEQSNIITTIEGNANDKVGLNKLIYSKERNLILYRGGDVAFNYIGVPMYPGEEDFKFDKKAT